MSARVGRGSSHISSQAWQRLMRHVPGAPKVWSRSCVYSGRPALPQAGQSGTASTWMSSMDAMDFGGMVGKGGQRMAATGPGQQVDGVEQAPGRQAVQGAEEAIQRPCA